MPKRREGPHGRAGSPRDEQEARASAAPHSSEAEQRESDELVQWLGGAMNLPDPGDPGNAEYFDWLARDLRGRQRPAERMESTSRADAFAARMVSSRTASRVRLMSVAGPPVVRAPSSGDATVKRATELAARERAAVIVDHAVAAGVGRELWDEPAEKWVELPASVPDGRYVALTVAGESMLPALHDGDVVLVKLGSEIARGAVVVARRPEDGYVVKRVGAIGEREVELTSLNAAFAPVRIPRDERLVVGTVVLRWCGHGDGRAGPSA